MIKIIEFSLLVFITINSINCRDEPIPPCIDCPQPFDTTSHNWNFEPPIYFGDGASSALYDVAIINDTLAYAVGEIRKQDSLGNWENEQYCLAVWNGIDWKLKRLYYYNPNSLPPTIFPLTVRGIFAFNATDVWLAAGSIFHWNGKDSLTELSSSGVTASVTKLWGISSTDLYGVGYAGTIVHYNGSTWTKIESGTSLNITDIWGDYNSTINQYEVLCCASNIGESLDKEVLKVSSTNVQKLDNNGIGGTLHSIWFKAGTKYYVAGAGIFDKNTLSDTIWKSRPNDTLRYYTNQIRGNAANDIVASGNFSEILHYNGNTWMGYYDKTNIENGGYASIAIKNNLLIAVGSNSPKAASIIGRRK